MVSDQVEPLRIDPADDPAAAEQAEPDGRLYGGKSASQRRAERRRRLQDAALELFASQGYAATTITSICRSASVTTQHFYDEFATREALLLAVYDEIAHDSAVAVGEALAAAGTGRQERTRAGLAAFLHAMLDDPRRARVQCIEAVGVSPAFEVHRQQVVRLYSKLVTEEAAVIAGSEGHSAVGARYVVDALVGAAEAAMVSWLSADEPSEIDELLDQLVGIYVAVGERFSSPVGDVGTTAGAKARPDHQR